MLAVVVCLYFSKHGIKPKNIIQSCCGGIRFSVIEISNNRVVVDWKVDH